MVKESPTFAQIWQEYSSYFRHYSVVMHNAGFDASVLKKAAKHKENAAAKKMVELIEKTLSAGKAEDIVVIDLSGKTALADYLVVATGRAPRHVTALGEQVQLRLKKTGVPAAIEGNDTGDWVIVDAGDVIVHVFHPETRELYCIEELWGEETPRKAR